MRKIEDIYSLNLRESKPFNYWLALKHSYHLAGKMIPWTFIIFLILMLYGCLQGLFFAPSDHQQGEIYRIMYVHVPCAILSLSIYTIIFFTVGIFIECLDSLGLSFFQKFAFKS